MKKDTRDLVKEMDELKQLMSTLVERVGAPPAADKVARVVEPVATRRSDPREKIEAALRREILGPKNLAAVVGEPQAKVEKLLEQLQAEGRVYNLRPPDLKPGVYVWRIGESSTQKDRVEIIIKLLEHSHYNNGDLMKILNIDDSKLVENALNEIRRRSVENGRDLDIRSRQIDGHSRLYSIGPYGGEPAPLAPKKSVKKR